MSNILHRFVNRPIIHIPFENDKNLVVGFGLGFQTDKLDVFDYIENKQISVPVRGTVIYTRQRLDAIFSIKRAELISLLFVPVHERIFPDENSFNSLMIEDRLFRNNFWQRYNDYLTGNDIQEIEK